MKKADEDALRNRLAVSGVPDTELDELLRAYDCYLVEKPNNAVDVFASSLGSQTTPMAHTLQLLRSYYRTNIRARNALMRAVHRQPALPLSLAVGGYLALTLSLHGSGHTTAAWIATAVLGLPRVMAGWLA